MPLIKKASLSFNDLKEKSLRLLTRRDHSLTELKTKLKQRGSFEESSFQQLVVYLQRLGYLVPDDTLALRWVQHWRSEGRGRLWILAKLKTKGLTEPDDLKDDEQEIKNAQNFAQRKFKKSSFKHLSYKERLRVARALSARGFSSTVVSGILGS